MRIDKTNYYLDLAETILERGTCLRRNYGAVIVKNDEVISTGYTGAPRGRANCINLNKCIREELNSIGNELESLGEIIVSVSKELENNSFDKNGGCSW